eukprot:SAG31_NODE_2568_length_5463_cov_3.107196_4_plen_120_part_00
MKSAGSARDAVEEFNKLCDESGSQPMDSKNTQLLRDLAAHGPEGITASKRVRRPIVTKANRRDRLSMANVITKAKAAGNWSFAKNVVCGDQFMVELGSDRLTLVLGQRESIVAASQLYT